jgi:intein/homing endonuclease
LFPENRTEYLELDTPVFIPSTTSDGKTTEWMELTAVTRHLPVGDLIKIKTRTGKEVTATSQKSFLVYDETQDKLVEKDGSRIQVGDKVGIQLQLENQDLCPFEFTELKYDEKWNNIGLESIVSVEKISSRTDPSDENSPLKNVYDVTVPKSLNFNLFNGLVMSD